MQLKIVEREWTASRLRDGKESPVIGRKSPTKIRRDKFQQEYRALLSDTEAILHSDSDDEVTEDNPDQTIIEQKESIDDVSSLLAQSDY